MRLELDTQSQLHLIATSISFIISIIAALILLALRHVISYAFTDGQAVADAVSDLCPLLAVTLILNGIQPVLSGNMDRNARRHSYANPNLDLGHSRNRLE
ncbi:hypothetical protein CsSME_00027038 [Camellia sinensis var. sinensis]